MIPLCLLIRCATDLAVLGAPDAAATQPEPQPEATESAPSARAALVDWADAPTLAQDGMSGGYDGWHFDVGAGLTSTESQDGPDEEIDFDEGAGFSLGLVHRSGTDDGDRWAWDFGFETVWTDQDSDNPDADPVRDFTVAAALLTGVADFGLTESIGLYAGAGLGIAWLDVGTQDDAISNFEEEDGPFLAWQLRAGGRWWSSENISWNLGWRFLNVDSAEIDDSNVSDLDFDLETQQHMAEIGVRFHL